YAADVGRKLFGDFAQQLCHWRFQLKPSGATGEWTGIAKQGARRRMKYVHLSRWRPSGLGHEVELNPQLCHLGKCNAQRWGGGYRVRLRPDRVPTCSHRRGRALARLSRLNERWWESPLRDLSECAGQASTADDSSAPPVSPV